jgi:hypothetical protein
MEDEYYSDMEDGDAGISNEGFPDSMIEPDVSKISAKMGRRDSKGSIPVLLHRQGSQSSQESGGSDSGFPNGMLSRHNSSSSLNGRIVNGVSVPLPEVKKEKTWIGGKTQDYIGIASIHSIQAPYSRSQLLKSLTQGDLKMPLCSLCRKMECQMMFFPCEHCCVCSKCISIEQFVDQESRKLTPSGAQNCPLCAQIIKKMIPFDKGKELDKYWSWVNEVSPTLPRGFMRNFKHSAAVIQKVWIDDNKKDTEKNKGSMSCTIC